MDREDGARENEGRGRGELFDRAGETLGVVGREAGLNRGVSSSSTQFRLFSSTRIDTMDSNERLSSLSSVKLLIVSFSSTESGLVEGKYESHELSDGTLDNSESTSDAFDEPRLSSLSTVIRGCRLSS